MFIKFNEDSQRILILARKEMLELKHPYVGTEHLLLAILHCSDLKVTEILREYNITYTLFKKEIVRVIGYGNKHSNWFLYTPLLKKILEEVILECREDGSVVSVEKLFLALLSEGEGIANRLLLGMNIDINALYNTFMKKLNVASIDNKKLLIESFAVDFNNECLNNKFDPVIGRDKQINKIIEILYRKNKNNPLLIGEAGVGKTALVEELSRRIVNGDVPDKLKNVHILSLSLSSLVSGTKYRGEFEERISKMISELDGRKDIILFIDEFHTIVGLGGADGAIDASNIIKPYLARGNIRIIGATTNNEYSKYIEKDKALDRRFQKIYVNEPNMEETVDILLNIKEIYENYHGVSIEDEIINEIVKLSSRFISGGHQPDKSIDILDEACSKASLIESKYEKKIQNLVNSLNKLKIEKNNKIIQHDYDAAKTLKIEEAKLDSKINKMVHDKTAVNFKRLTIKNIYDVIYEKTKIPIEDIISLTDKKAYLYLKERVIGQDKLIRKILNVTFNRDYVTKNVPNSLLLIGKTGVGKTLFVKEYAKLLFPTSELLRLDMSEYKEKSSVTKIIGAPPGYIGYSEKNNFLFKVKNNPYSVILLDEIEKADTDVLKLFLQVFDEGYLNNSEGEKIDFSNTTIFLTSNLGMNYTSIGYGDDNRLKREEINSFLGIEMVNRIDDVIFFNDLTENDIRKIISKYLDKKKIKISTEIVDKILLESDYKNFGARKIEKIIDKNIKKLEVVC